MKFATSIADSEAPANGLALGIPFKDICINTSVQVRVIGDAACKAGIHVYGD